ncbi:MAG: tRNA (N6-threonylcarbamoyladenosine(37)-N6)-methyltransferase TrmO [Bacteroidota bacterium]|nr:tRNA (N6-threonylcarbamoyladenosine(37)-N6)-methyltransferase TrmO [Bacteroidota bacterium]
MDDICYTPIAVVESPFTRLVNMPIQSLADNMEKGKIIVDPKYAEGLKDIEKFSHLYILYHFHLSQGYNLTTKPFLDDNEHGIFSIRGPRRPNSIGLSIVKLEKRVENVLYISGIDMVDATPVLDIKPYIPAFDTPENASSGWMNHNKKKVGHTRSDERFVKNRK